MWHRYDANLRTSILRALEAGGREGAAQADARHILLGTLTDPNRKILPGRMADVESLAAGLRLPLCGINTNDPRAAVAAAALSDDARRLLDRAYDHAAQLNHRDI